MSLRWRLTLYYSLVSTIIVFLGGAVFFLALSHSLQQSLDSSLEEVVLFAKVLLEGEEKGQFNEGETDKLLEHLSGGIVLLVFDKQGQELDRVGHPTIKAPFIKGFSTVDKQRIFAIKLSNGYWIQAMRSDVEILKTLGQAQRLFLISLPFLLLIGFGFGFWLADHALKPVDRVTRLAQSIANLGRYHKRVPESLGKDEMSRLTQTFNHMLTRLEATIKQERAFALAAAHELRNPLTFIRARASLSLEKERSAKEYKSAIEQIYNTSQEMTQIIASLLVLAQTNQAPQYQEISLAELIIEVAEIHRVEAEKQSICFEFSLEEVRVSGDKNLLRLALSNLVQNAIKYGQVGGHVWLKSACEKQEVCVEICDDGAGIPIAELERLRQPFQRGLGLQAVTGSGLGLALVSAIAEQHKGRLDLTNSTQGGLKAVLWLPL